MRLPTKQIAASSDEEQSAQQGSRACLRVCLCGGGTCRLTMEANADLRRTPRSACACARARAAPARWVTRTRCTSPRSRVAPPFARARDRVDTSAPSRSRPPLRPATRVHAEAASAHGGQSALRRTVLQWLASWREPAARRGWWGTQRAMLCRAELFGPAALTRHALQCSTTGMPRRGTARGGRECRDESRQDVVGVADVPQVLLHGLPRHSAA